MPDYNLFMVCDQLQSNAFVSLPNGYHIRPCKKEELPIWKAMPFDDKQTAQTYDAFMQEYYERVYQPNETLFFEHCLFLCNDEDRPIGTAFIWKAYDEITTLHWVKIIKSYEDKKLGRALLSAVLSQVEEKDYPIYLHTQPGSYRAIKLYSDFGFKLITDKVVGNRINHLEESLPLLKKDMPEEYFKQLQMVKADTDFLNQIAKYQDEQF